MNKQDLDTPLLQVLKDIANSLRRISKTEWAGYTFIEDEELEEFEYKQKI
jgi:hypothetical protein